MLVDTSVWIEFFRKREPYFSIVTELMDNDEVCCVGIVLAELLQGSKSETEFNTIREFLHVFIFLPETADGWERAGELSFALSRKGKSVSLSDCYIAAAAKTHGVKLLTLDKHFAAIQKETSLNLYTI
ncbi:MAG: PIN domain-containing protein [bacterium]